MSRTGKPWRTRRLLLATALLSTATAAQSPPPAPGQTPWTDTSLSPGQRADALIHSMTLEEKVQQMRDRAPAIPRLGIPRYDWWNEGLHGVAFAGYATNFPQVIGMAATWDESLVHSMAETISTEARAKYNQSIRQDQHEMFFGLTFWAPNINIFRDPRWGRGQETYGEDPFLTARMGVNFVRGMQGDDPDYLRVVSTPKHYAVHSGPESTRHQANVDVSAHDLEDTYLPAFRATVTEAHAQSVMCAYNSIDGAPACASPMLLRDHLRQAWGFQGYVVSDCAAVADINTGHHFAPSMARAAADAVKAGTDLECGFGDGQAFPALVDAVQQHLLSEAEIDTALHRLFLARIRLGMFDPPASFAYGRIPISENNSPEHRQLSLRAARESMTLLKNADSILPLRNPKQRIAVIGPTAELVQSLQGNYNGTPPNPVFPLQGIQQRFGASRVSYSMGAPLVEGLPIPVAHTALHPAPGSPAFGLRAEYFSTRDLSGKPAATRVDQTIDFNWDKAVPAPGLQRNNFSVRWSGVFVPPAPGAYTLGVHINDCYACDNAEAYRLYVDDALVTGSGTGQNAGHGPVSGKPMQFADTRPHRIRLEYLHGTGSAGVQLTWIAPLEVLRSEAVRTARAADVIVACLGLSPSLEGEEMPVHLPGFSGGDRTSIDLPAAQEDLLKALVSTGKPVIVVLQNGSALAVNYAAEHAAAILEAWYPGEEGGTAIAETLAGDNNPAGRLPITVYRSVDQLPPFADYTMQGRTYRYLDQAPLFPFGHGLSYTTFTYSNPELSTASIQAGSPLQVHATVTNSGRLAGDEVAELYLTPPHSSTAPHLALVGFHRLHLLPGQSQTVTFTIDPRSLSQVDGDGNRAIRPGQYALALGGSQPGPNTRQATFTITGTQPLPR